MRNDSKESTGTKNEVDVVKTEKFRKDDSSGGSGETPKQPPTRPLSNRCYRCGKSPGHVQQNCPAKAAVCHKCSKKGHWASVCKYSHTVGKIEEDYAFLGAIGTERNADVCFVNQLRPSLNPARPFVAPPTHLFPFLAASWESSREKKNLHHRKYLW